MATIRSIVALPGVSASSSLRRLGEAPTWLFGVVDSISRINEITQHRPLVFGRLTVARKAAARPIQPYCPVRHILKGLKPGAQVFRGSADGAIARRTAAMVERSFCMRLI